LDSLEWPLNHPDERQIDDLAYKAFGWTMRSLMVLRDNYLGGFTHYQTLSEFLDKLKRNRPVGDPMELQYRPGSVSRYVSNRAGVGNDYSSSPTLFKSFSL
jgi:hypothetical protein